MNKIQRKEWLSNLTVKQLRALACQLGLRDWRILPKMKLISVLSAIENAEQPKSTWKIQ